MYDGHGLAADQPPTLVTPTTLAPELDPELGFRRALHCSGNQWLVALTGRRYKAHTFEAGQTGLKGGGWCSQRTVGQAKQGHHAAAGQDCQAQAIKLCRLGLAGAGVRFVFEMGSS